MSVAAVDIGTNSARLLIIDDAGRELERVMRITRLGEGVDERGALAEAAMDRTVSVLDDYGAAILRARARRVRAVATSAARDAGNRETFLDRAERALGVRPELLSEESEAALSFRGATADLRVEDGPFLVFDIGGGSTEFVLGAESPVAWASMKVGCVRMTERYFSGDSITAERRAACAADVKQELTAVKRALETRTARRVVGLAGTVTSLAAFGLRLQRHDISRTHHSRLTRSQVTSLFEELCSVDLATRRSLLTEPARAAEIIGGTAVLSAILDELGIEEIVVSEKDLLDGIVIALGAQT